MTVPPMHLTLCFSYAIPIQHILTMFQFPNIDIEIVFLMSFDWKNLCSLTQVLFFYSPFLFCSVFQFEWKSRRLWWWWWRDKRKETSPSLTRFFISFFLFLFDWNGLWTRKRVTWRRKNNRCIKWLWFSHSVFNDSPSSSSCPALISVSQYISSN